MATPPVSLYVRIIGTAAYYTPVITAGPVTLTETIAGQSYMVYPDGQSDLVWEGGVFGLSAPSSGGLTANVWDVAVTVSHFVSDPASFTSVTAQVYDTSTSSVTGSQAFTLSATAVTETFSLRTGYTAADVPDLAIRLTWHQVATGYAVVQHAYAAISYSYSDAAGSFTIAGTASVPVPAVTVAPLPPVSLVSAGTVATSLSPSFGLPTVAGELLVAWVFVNSPSVTFATTCSNPSWVLAGYAGGAYAWDSLWYKYPALTAETAPVFADSGYSAPLSQLLIFSGASYLDQAGSAAGGQDLAITSAGADTASGDLVFAFCVWVGTNTGPTTASMTGGDSSGAPLALSVADNASSGGVQFWAAGWAQASAAAGPLMDTVTASLGFYGGSGGVVASFLALGAPPPQPLPEYAAVLRRT